MNLSIFSSRLASVGLAGVIAVGVLGAGGVAMAQTPGGGSATTQGTATRNHPKLKLGVAELLKNAGVTREELKEGAAAKMTLGQIIDKYGDISSSQAKTNALKTISDRLDKAVSNGKLTQDQADKLEAAAPAMLDRLLNAVPGAGDSGGKHPRIRGMAANALETVADVLDTDVASIAAQLKDGKTIAQIAGPQTQSVIDALTEDANQAIDKAVADGKLPANKEESAKEKAAAAIERVVNEGRPNRGHGN
mgnify:CR=1 FL=1